MCSRESRAGLPEPSGSRRSASSPGSKTAPPQAHSVRAALDGENAVADWAHQQASPTTLTHDFPCLLPPADSREHSAQRLGREGVSDRRPEGSRRRRLDAQHQSAAAQRRRMCCRHPDMPLIRTRPLAGRSTMLALSIKTPGRSTNGLEEIAWPSSEGSGEMPSRGLPNPAISDAATARRIFPAGQPFPKTHA